MACSVWFESQFLSVRLRNAIYSGVRADHAVEMESHAERRLTRIRVQRHRRAEDDFRRLQ